MKKLIFELDTEFIRLCDLLKITGLADSGAQGKHLVADGQVKVDGQPESRKTAKIRPGQVVNCKYTDIVVEGIAIKVAPPRPDMSKPAAKDPWAGESAGKSSSAKPSSPKPSFTKPSFTKPLSGKPPARKFAARPPATRKGPANGA